MQYKGVFVASTGQNVGKTTTCLGLLSGLKKQFRKVAFMKPVGQEHVEVAKGPRADKDVVLFKDHFGLDASYEEMSPVLFPRGFTKKILDGEIERQVLCDRILHSFTSLEKSHDFVLVEGTGHVGVGSITDLNNAQVAALLEIPVILVAPGGVGSTFDALALNKTVCDKYGVSVVGVILNRVVAEKREMILQYMTKALKRWNIPLLGC